MEQLERIPKHEAMNDVTIATADIIFLSLSSFNARRELNRRTMAQPRFFSPLLRTIALTLLCFQQCYRLVMG